MKPVRPPEHASLEEVCFFVPLWVYVSRSVATFMENDSELKPGWNRFFALIMMTGHGSRGEEDDLENLPMTSPKIAINFIKPEVILTASVSFLASSCHWALYL